MDAPGKLIKRAIVNGIQNGRHGLGSVFVFASGNGAGYDDNCNFDGYTNSIYSITVGAIDRMGLHPYYSEACSANLVVTYSSGSNDAIVGPPSEDLLRYCMELTFFFFIAHYRCRGKRLLWSTWGYFGCCPTSSRDFCACTFCPP